MTFEQANLSLHLLAEERIGFVQRERMRMAREIEDAAFARAAGATSGPG